MRETTRTILTAVTVATVMALLLPVGAQAAGQLMTIVDADTNAKAQVENGKLRVGDGRGALTVNGAVASRPATPADPFSVTGFVTGVEDVSLGRGRIAVTDIIISYYNGNNNLATYFSMHLYRDGGNGDCTTLGAHLKTIFQHTMIPDSDTLAVQLSTPVIATEPLIPTTRPVCLRIDSNAGDNTIFTYSVTGYRT